MLTEYLPDKYDIECTFVDSSNLEEVKTAIRPNTKLIHIETPGNPVINISDIEEIAKIAHSNNVLLSVDNTFASLYNQRPTSLGADLSIESLTKYINGHGDAMGGAVLGKKALIDKIRNEELFMKAYSEYRELQLNKINNILTSEQRKQLNYCRLYR